jgi:hypothetical protein
MQSNAGYVSYLLRLWQVQSDKHATWVASVQSTATGDRRSFSSVAALIEFLQAEFAEPPQTGPSPTPLGRAEPGIEHMTQPA